LYFSWKIALLGLISFFPESLNASQLPNEMQTGLAEKERNKILEMYGNPVSFYANFHFSLDLVF